MQLILQTDGEMMKMEDGMGHRCKCIVDLYIKLYIAKLRFAKI